MHWKNNNCAFFSLLCVFFLFCVAFENSFHLLQSCIAIASGEIFPFERRGQFNSTEATQSLNPLFPTPKHNPASSWSPSKVQEYRADGKRIVPNRVLHKVESMLPTEMERKKMVLSVVESLLPQTDAPSQQHTDAPSNQQTDAPSDPQTDELSSRQAEDTVSDDTVSELADPFAIADSEEIDSAENDSEETAVAEDDTDDSDDVVVSPKSASKLEKKYPAPKNKETASSKGKYKFGNRMGRGGAAPQSNPLIGKNLTYFPKDHQADLTVFRFIHTMANEERQVLNKMGRDVRGGMKRFSAVLEQFPPPTDDGKRPRLTAKQQRLFNSMRLQEADDKYCEGCPIMGSYPIRRVTRNPGRLVFRKFVGNQEIARVSIHDSEPFCEKCKFNVTAIMVT
ncbi:hypothetical protein WA577_002204, partial [Blastocystis sp. JDR]